MRLYHFAQLHYVRDIKKEGIKPTVDKQGLPLPPHGVVWLTSKPEHTLDHEPECCITVFIPPADKRLVKWETWLRQHGEHEILAASEDNRHGRLWRSFFCYFGVVPPSMLRKISLTPAGQRRVDERKREARQGS
jgi:hypothetical protein